MPSPTPACPRCGRPLPAFTRNPLCPACLASAATRRTRLTVLLAAAILAASVVLGGLARTSGGSIPHTVLISAALSGVFGGVLLGRLLLGKRRQPRSRPDALRLALGLVIVLLAIGLGSFRIAALHARRNHHAATIDRAITERHQALEAARTFEHVIRSTLPHPTRPPSPGSPPEASPPQPDPQPDNPLNRDLHEAVRATRKAEAQLAVALRARAIQGQPSPSWTLRAWLPTLPVFVAALIIVLRPRQPTPPHPARPNRPTWTSGASIVTTALALALATSALIDRHYAQEPADFEAHFLDTPPTAPAPAPPPGTSPAPASRGQAA